MSWNRCGMLSWKNIQKKLILIKERVYGSDDEKQDYDYLASVAISEDDSPHIYQVSIPWTTAIFNSQYLKHVKILVFKCLTQYSVSPR